MSFFSASIFSGEINFSNKVHKYCGETVSKNLRDFICFHQGEFIQFAFLAGEYHKALKTEFSKENRSRDTIASRHDELLEYLNEKIGAIVSSSFSLIQNLYSDRHVKSPRICLKVNFDPKEEMVVGLFREQNVGYVSDCSVNENKGFQYIKENGQYFLCQDIPKEAQKGEYFNPRLIKQAVDIYQSLGRIKRYFKTKDKVYVDENWVNCWKRIETENGQPVRPHYRSCYKSTLIIPLTLLNNNLNKKFIEKFNIPNVNRTIFGYLCFDHVEINYFKPIFDVDVGYIFADILSLYLLVRFIFVNQSATYDSVKRFLDC